MAHYYPPVAFHFKVEVLDLGRPNDNDMRFTDVGGLSMELATEELAEGGENRFVQKFPVRGKYPELTLKRGVLVGSEVFNWIRSWIQEFDVEHKPPLTPKNIDVKLLDKDHQPLITWHLVNAYPTKWSVSDLSASANSVSVESLQFFYQHFTVDSVSAAGA